MDDSRAAPHARAPEPQDLVRICRALNDARARDVLIGGFAVLAHGAGRFTKDIDLLVDDDPANVALVKQGLSVLADNAAADVADSDGADGPGGSCGPCRESGLADSDEEHLPPSGRHGPRVSRRRPASARGDVDRPRLSPYFPDTRAVGQHAHPCPLAVQVPLRGLPRHRATVLRCRWPAWTGGQPRAKEACLAGALANPVNGAGLLAERPRHRMARTRVDDGGR